MPLLLLPVVVDSTFLRIGWPESCYEYIVVLFFFSNIGRLAWCSATFIYCRMPVNAVLMENIPHLGQIIDSLFMI